MISGKLERKHALYSRVKVKENSPKLGKESASLTLLGTAPKREKERNSQKREKDIITWINIAHTRRDFFTRDGDMPLYLRPSPRYHPLIQVIMIRAVVARVIRAAPLSPLSHARPVSNRCGRSSCSRVAGRIYITGSCPIPETFGLITPGLPSEVSIYCD